MATRSARDNKALNARHAETLKAMLRLPENKTCADCKRNDPRWASANLGCFMCIRCSGIHRSMGVHITRIKSIDLDTWTSEQVATVQRWGNRRANAYWEAHLRPGHMPPDHKIESFIRSKYESKRWVMDGPMPEPETLDEEGGVDTQTTSTPAAPVSSAAPRRPSATLGKAAAAPPATTTFSLLDAPPASNPSHSSKTSIQTNPGSGNVPNLNPANAGGGLFDLDFSPSASAAAVTATAPAARKDVKNDILSLFASKPSIPYGPTLPTTTQPAGNLGGLHQQFGGLQMSSPTGPAVGSQNDTWGQFGGSGNTTQSNDTFNSSSSAFGFGGSNQTAPPPPQTENLFGGLSEPWATTTTQGQQPASLNDGSGNLFGGLSDPWATTTTQGQQPASLNDGFGNFTGATKSSNVGGNDAFSDIWN